MLDELLAELKSMPAKEKAALVACVIEERVKHPFIPNDGPQNQAYYCEADITLFGGSPGGGKSGLLIGLGLNVHHRSLIIRKSFADLGGLLDTTEKIVGSSANLTRGARPRYDKPGGGVIHFAGLSDDGGIGGHQGVDHDFIGIDEGAQIPERQVRLLMGWLRTDRPGQRCRVVLASNPPLDPTGDWMIDFFGPWLNPTHPRPAKPGELRWFLPPQSEGGKDRECASDDTMLIAGIMVKAQSRTFIPSKFTDNPFYDRAEYSKTLAALPADVREILVTGNFMLARKDQTRQAIPTAWVRAAQARWTPKPAPGVPQCAIAVDASGGGSDPCIISKRHDGWYPPLEKIEGKDIPMHRLGKHQAGLVVSHRRDDSQIVVDMGGGYGGPIYEQLAENIDLKEITPYKGAEGTTLRTKDGKMGFFNVRSAAIWKFREALDPEQEGGSPIMLPDDPELVADLTAPSFEITPKGYKVESKEDVCDRLQRSTDKGDAVVMCWYAGQKYITVTGETFTAEQGGKRRGGSLEVNHGPRRSMNRR